MLKNKIKTSYGIFKKGNLDYLFKVLLRKIKRGFGLGSLPDFLIIGATKGGTTSVYHTLTQHPDVLSSTKKEIQYFTLHFDENLSWYKSYFPSFKKIRGKITGEASPYYLFHPLAPERIHKLSPEVKLIVLLRNPVDRAFSHYVHNIDHGQEKLESFEEAIEAEEKRISKDVQKVLNGEYSFDHHKHTYLSRGEYAKQLERWFKYYGRENFLIIKSRDLFLNPQQEYKKMFDFLGIKQYDVGGLRTLDINKTDYKKRKIKESTRGRLVNYFKPYNEELYGVIGKDFHWE